MTRAELREIYRRHLACENRIYASTTRAHADRGVLLAYLIEESNEPIHRPFRSLDPVVTRSLWSEYPYPVHLSERRDMRPADKDSET